MNIPIHLCLEQGIFKKYGLDVKYTEVKEGTGAMMKSLEACSADIAVVVTGIFLEPFCNHSY